MTNSKNCNSERSDYYLGLRNDVRNKYEAKIAECVELSKKCCYYDKLVDELIKENNKLHDKIKKQDAQEEDIWDWIARNLPAPWDLDYDDMDEFN